MQANQRCKKIIKFTKKCRGLPVLIFHLQCPKSAHPDNSLTDPIFSEVLETRALIFSSVGVWEHYEPRVCDIARLFVAHLDSNELGLSIWGFIIITKQFVLSVSFSLFAFKNVNSWS
jgi:hypothetical protein